MICLGLPNNDHSQILSISHNLTQLTSYCEPYDSPTNFSRSNGAPD